MAAKSKTYFLLDYRFISYIYILFISVFPLFLFLSLSCFIACKMDALHVFKSIVALFWSLAAERFCITLLRLHGKACQWNRGPTPSHQLWLYWGALGILSVTVHGKVNNDSSSQVHD